MIPILVIIPCLNEEAHIERLVVQLMRQNETMPMRIVIADGGSADNTAHIAQQLTQRYGNVHYLHNPKRLQSAAMNLAVATYGEGLEFLIRIDAHADYPDDYCQRLIEEAQRTGAASVVVSVETQGISGFQKAVAAAQNSKLGNGGSPHRCAPVQGHWVDHGSHALMRIDAFRAIGGYDESFSHNEDAELDTRLIKAGYKIWLTANTTHPYYPRATPLALLRQFYNYGRGRQRTVAKHHTPLKWRQMLPLAVAPAVLLALFAPLYWPLCLPLLAWATLCVVYGLYLGESIAIPAAMIMHFGWSFGYWRGRLLG